MKALILAAGVGRRLYPLTEHRPKCLIEFAGQTLLARYLKSLSAFGVQEGVVVVGYQENVIREAVASDPSGVDVRFIVNQDYQRGSITSLWAARDELENDDTLIMDADVLFHPNLLRRLMECSARSALLMDETVSQKTEECMVAIRDGQVVALSKRIPEQFDLAGEGVGFLKLGKADAPLLVRSIEGYVKQGKLDMEYEDALTEFFEQVPVGYEMIGGTPWIEIDFPEDVERAEREVLRNVP